MGANILFPYGLALGTAVAIVNLHVLSVSLSRAIEKGKKAPVYLGTAIRIIIYGAVLYMAVRTDVISGIGCMVGFVLPQAAIRVRQVIWPKIRKAAGKEPAAEYRLDERSKTLLKEPWIETYYGGRLYKTHRRFRKYKKVVVTGERKAGRQEQRDGDGTRPPNHHTV